MSLAFRCEERAVDLLDRSNKKAMTPLNQIGDNPDTMTIKSEEDGMPFRHHTTMALVLWSGVIAMAGMLPLSNFVGHPHWEHIQWIVTPRHWRSPKFYFDVVANIALFYPFGLLLARRFPSVRWPPAFGLISIGLLFSLSIELFQVYCHNRHPSPVDLISNTLGTTVGVASSRRVFSHPLLNARLPRPHSHPTGS
ncbi:MAG: VanZ family protein [Nitrospiraceae bacterium]|nr:VanZ family protein [Nitrospiraceae bacterium]